MCSERNERIQSLDVSGCTELTLLECSQNELTEIDVSDCVALGALYCTDNRFTDLDLSHNPELVELVCDPGVTVDDGSLGLNDGDYRWEDKGTAEGGPEGAPAQIKPGC